MAERELYPSEKQERFIVRFPDGMRDRIKAAAEANNRSMNAEIVATLEEKYPSEPPDLGTIFHELAQLSGVLNMMTEKDRRDAVATKLKDLERRGAQDINIFIDNNALELVVGNGGIRSIIGLDDPAEDYGEEA
ncbi:Arc family DNA-binding protein [Xinfangfangia sp. D13-10-4-6]|uniref:Arc family DNA-binding protein n=1 Tax=Pseudogemmobacter hezensis TaxID=2737662 RepID=UPI00155525B0|nr:Arc family DNA-binding protein [Pseudogemmobacter hezensis]NPD15775.1 Arc family DNA-binding protein [Pseudogemmobacter hezensis]